MTVEQSSELWGTLYAIGAEYDEDMSPKPPAAVDWLIMRGFAETTKTGLQLTTKGKQAYKVMESGIGMVPEIDGADFEV